MKFNLIEAIKSVKDEDLKDGKGKPFLYRDAIYIALNSQTKDEVIPAEEKAKIFQLSLKIYKDKEADLTDDERVLIKERAGKILDAISYGRILELFEEKKEITSKPK